MVGVSNSREVNRAGHTFVGPYIPSSVDLFECFNRFNTSSIYGYYCVKFNTSGHLYALLHDIPHAQHINSTSVERTTVVLSLLNYMVFSSLWLLVPCYIFIIIAIFKLVLLVIGFVYSCVRLIFAVVCKAFSEAPSPFEAHFEMLERRRIQFVIEDRNLIEAVRVYGDQLAERHALYEFNSEEPGFVERVNSDRPLYGALDYILARRLEEEVYRQNRDAENERYRAHREYSMSEEGRRRYIDPETFWGLNGSNGEATNSDDVNALPIEISLYRTANDVDLVRAFVQRELDEETGQGRADWGSGVEFSGFEEALWRNDYYADVLDAGVLTRTFIVEECPDCFCSDHSLSFFETFFDGAYIGMDGYRTCGSTLDRYNQFASDSSFVLLSINLASMLTVEPRLDKPSTTLRCWFRYKVTYSYMRVRRRMLIRNAITCEWSGSVFIKNEYISPINVHNELSDQCRSLMHRCTYTDSTPFFLRRLNRSVSVMYVIIGQGPLLSLVHNRFELEEFDRLGEPDDESDYSCDGETIEVDMLEFAEEFFNDFDLEMLIDPEFTISTLTDESTGDGQDDVEDPDDFVAVNTVAGIASAMSNTPAEHFWGLNGSNGEATNDDDLDVQAVRRALGRYGNAVRNAGVPNRAGNVHIDQNERRRANNRVVHARHADHNAHLGPPVQQNVGGERVFCCVPGCQHSLGIALRPLQLNAARGANGLPPINGKFSWSGCKHVTCVLCASQHFHEHAYDKNNKPGQAKCPVCAKMGNCKMSYFGTPDNYVGRGEFEHYLNILAAHEDDDGNDPGDEPDPDGDDYPGGIDPPDNGRFPAWVENPIGGDLVPRSIPHEKRVIFEVKFLEDKHFYLEVFCTFVGILIGIFMFRSAGQFSPIMYHLLWYPVTRYHLVWLSVFLLLGVCLFCCIAYSYRGAQVRFFYGLEAERRWNHLLSARGEFGFSLAKAFGFNGFREVSVYRRLADSVASKLHHLSYGPILHKQVHKVLLEEIDKRRTNNPAYPMPVPQILENTVHFIVQRRIIVEEQRLARGVFGNQIPRNYF